MKQCPVPRLSARTAFPKLIRYVEYAHTSLEVRRSLSAMRARFPENPVTTICRPPTSEESAALTDFEWHAGRCRECAYPYLKRLDGSYLCSSGFHHGRRLAKLMFQDRSRTYSTSSTPELRIVVEIEKGFRCCIEFLLTATWHLSCSHSGQSVISRDIVAVSQKIMRSGKRIRISYVSHTMHRYTGFDVA